MRGPPARNTRMHETLGWEQPLRSAAVTYEFDRFLRYDELTAWLHELAAAHPALVTVEEYGRSYEGRPLWLVTVTDAETGRHEAKPAHWVDASIHAVELTGDRRRLPAAAAPRRRLHGGRPGRHRGRADPDVLRRAAGQPRRRRVGARRPAALPALEHAAVAVGRRPPLAGRARRGRRRRRPGPADAHPRSATGRGWPHADDARLLVPVPLDGAPAGTPRYRMLDEGTRRRPRRVHDPDAEPARGPRPQPQLPGRLGHPGPRLGRPPAVGAGDRRPRAGHRRPPQRVRLQRLPHERRRAAAAVVDRGRLGAAAGRRLGVEAARRDRPPPDRATRCTRSTRTSRGTSPTR